MTAVADIQERRTKRHVHAYAGHPLSRFLVRRRTVFAAVVPWLVFAFAEPEVLLYGLGLGVLALGSGLRVWAAGHLRKDEELTTSGPYAHCQHPLYCASLVQVAGVGLMSGRLEALLGLLAAFALIYWPTIVAERRMLADVFGGVYEAYSRRVPQFWPRLTPAPDARGQFSWAQVRANREHANLAGGALIALLLALAAWR